jgi:hypothetical protein
MAAYCVVRARRWPNSCWAMKVPTSHTWPTLCKMFVCLPYNYFTFLHIMLWLCTISNNSVLATRKISVYKYQSGQKRTSSSISTLHAPAADRSDRSICGMNCLCPLKHWDRRIESHLRHGCQCVFILCVCVCCSVCAGNGLVMGWSLVQGVQLTVWKSTR